MRFRWLAFCLTGLLAALGGAPAAAGAAPAQPLAAWIHRSWDTFEGLPGLAAWALAETPDGALWVGTDGGLARFDGRSFEVIGRDPIRCLVVDRAGTLWMGTRGQGLGRFRDGELRRFGRDDGLPSSSVTALGLDPQGQLLVATGSGGVEVFHNGLLRPRLRVAEPVVAIATAGDRLYFATATELIVEERGQRQVHAVGTAAVPRAVRALAVGAAGEVFLATDQGLLRFREGALADPFGGRGPRGLLSLAPAADGSVWLGSLHGLWRVSPAGGELETLTPPHPAATAVVAALLPSRHGYLWFGSLDAGLHQLRTNPLRYWGEAEGLASNLVNSVAEDPAGNLWIASRHGGLDRLDPSRTRVDPASAGLPDRDLWSVAVDRDGTLWLGSSQKGLLRRRADGSWQSFGVAEGLPNSQVQAVRPTRDGVIWAATDQGLIRLTGDRPRVFTQADGLPSNAIRDIYEDRDGTRWIATMGGLARYQGIDRFVPFAGAGRPPAGVLSIWQDDRGALWLATAGGLAQIEDGRARTLTTRDGLYCDDLSCAMGDRFGFLWLATAKGLVRVALAELRQRLDQGQGELHQWIFERRSGLAANISNNGTAMLASSSGRLYFASSAGLLEVAADRLRPLAAPPARLDEVREKPRRWWQSLSSATAGSQLVFRFSALTAAAPDEIGLRYRLAGFDKDWRAAGASREVEYPRVPPGDYRFELEVGDQEGRFAPASRVVREVEVARRWGPLFASAGLLLALISALLMLLHRLRMRLLERREAELEQRAQVALTELQTISSLLPICSSCKKVRGDQGYWEELGSFFYSHAALEFEHGICPSCEAKLLERKASSGRVIRLVRATPGAAP